MSKDEASVSAKNMLEALLTHLRMARDTRIRTHKARMMDEFMVARRWLREVYKDFAPEDLPVDMNRVVRDMEVQRDSTLDADCEQIESEYRVAVSILSEVADKHPELYQKAIDETDASPRSWRHPARPVQARRTPVSGLPLNVVMHLTAVEQAKIIRALVENHDGLYLPKLCDLTSKKGDPFKKKALRQFLNFLRGAGHVTTEGAGRATRYVAAKSLKSYQRLTQ